MFREQRSPGVRPREQAAEWQLVRVGVGEGESKERDGWRRLIEVLVPLGGEHLALKRFSRCESAVERALQLGVLYTGRHTELSLLPRLRYNMCTLHARRWPRKRRLDGGESAEMGALVIIA